MIDSDHSSRFQMEFQHSGQSLLEAMGEGKVLQSLLFSYFCQAQVNIRKKNELRKTWQH